MPGIFDLTRVEKTIKNFRPTFVFVVDTNVLMNTPDPAEWKVAGDSALFIVTDTTLMELEYIKRRTERSGKLEDRETNLKAKTLIRNLANLFKSGSVTEGIQTSGGWVITVASPAQNALQQELDKINEIVEAFGRSDAKMLLLTKECNQLSGPDLVTLITGELNLHNIAQSYGVPCHLHTGFPISGLKVPEKRFPALDWDMELLAVQSTIRRTSVAVELTLNSKSCGSDRVGRQIIVAEGSGIIREMPENRGFYWTVRFHVGGFNERANAAGTASLGIEFDADIPSATLDFADEKKPSHHLYDAIVEKLVQCTEMNFTEGELSLQPPDEVMEVLHRNEAFFESTDHPLSEEEMEEIMKDPNWDRPISWLDWISNKNEKEKTELLSMVYLCVHNYWKMGQTYEFRLFV